MWIELVDKGVANRFDFEDYELIEMNWRLTNYPKLYYNIFQHEIIHKDGEYKFHDFVHDMMSRTPGLFKFMSNHISSWTQLLPFYWDRNRGQVVYDISAIISFVLIIGTATLIYYSLRWMI